MAKRVSRSKRSAPGTSDLQKLAKAASNKERTSFSQDFDEGVYTFRLREVTYGTRADPEKKVFATRCEFMTGPESYKGKAVRVSWNVDGRAINDSLTNFDLFYFFLDDLNCVPESFDPGKVAEKVKRVGPVFTATLSKSEGNQGGVFYNLRYPKKLSKAEVAALG